MLKESFTERTSSSVVKSSESIEVLLSLKVAVIWRIFRPLLGEESLNNLFSTTSISFNEFPVNFFLHLSTRRHCCWVSISFSVVSLLSIPSRAAIAIQFSFQINCVGRERKTVRIWKQIRQMQHDSIPNALNSTWYPGRMLTGTRDSVFQVHRYMIMNYCVNDLTNGEIMMWCCEWKQWTVNGTVCFLRRDFKEILSNPWFMK